MSDVYEVLQNRNFKLFIFSKFVAEIALQIQVVVVAWQVYRLSHDALSLGLIGLAEAIPAIGFALLAGHIVDRRERRMLVIASFTLSLLVILFLLILSLPQFSVAARQHVHLIYVLLFISGVARAFISPGTFALFAEIIPKKHYVSGATWSSGSWQLAAALGPALGGLIYGFYDVVLAYAVAGVLMALGIVLLFPLPRGKLVLRPSTEEESFSESLTVGLRFVFSNRLILSALSLDLFAVLFGGAVALLPIFASDILKVGPQGLGLMRAAPSVGALTMALFMAHRPPGRGAGRTLLIAVSGFGLMMILFGLSKNFFLTLLVLAVSGACDSFSVVVRTTILQIFTPDHMRGRVSSVNSIFIGSSNEIGAFESGLTAKWMGTVASVIFGGVMTLFVTGSTAFLAPELGELDLNSAALKRP